MIQRCFNCNVGCSDEKGIFHGVCPKGQSAQTAELFLHGGNFLESELTGHAVVKEGKCISLAFGVGIIIPLIRSALSQCGRHGFLSAFWMLEATMLTHNYAWRQGVRVHAEMESHVWARPKLAFGGRIVMRVVRRPLSRLQTVVRLEMSNLPAP